MPCGHLKQSTFSQQFCIGEGTRQSISLLPNFLFHACLSFAYNPSHRQDIHFLNVCTSKPLRVPRTTGLGLLDRGGPFGRANTSHVHMLVLSTRSPTPPWFPRGSFARHPTVTSPSFSALLACDVSPLSFQRHSPYSLKQGLLL